MYIFKDTMICDIGAIEKHLIEAIEFQNIWELQSFVVQINLVQALEASLVVMESSGTESENSSSETTSSSSGSDADADIGPSYDSDTVTGVRHSNNNMKEEHDDVDYDTYKANENNSNIISDIPNLDPDRDKEEHDDVDYEQQRAFFASLIINLKCDVEKCNKVNREAQQANVLLTNEFESAISETHSHAYENEICEQNSSVENENRCLKMAISHIQKDFSKMEAQKSGEKKILFKNETSSFETKIKELETILAQQTKDFEDAKVNFSNKTDKFETYFEKLENTKVVLERQLDRKIQGFKAEKDQFLKQIASLESKLASQDLISNQKEYSELRISYNALKAKFDALNRDKGKYPISNSSTQKVSVSPKIYTGESSKSFPKSVTPLKIGYAAEYNIWGATS
ncbi:hypothetical protein Tco_0436414 [Tanacetum coccineum]